MITKDYKSIAKPVRKRKPIRWRWSVLVAGGVAAAVMAARTDLPDQNSAARAELPRAASMKPADWAYQPLPDPAPAEPTDLRALLAGAEPSYSHTVKSGDTLSRIFSRAGLSPRVLQDLMHTKAPVLKTLYPGYRLEFHVAEDGLLQQMTLHQDRQNHAVFWWQAGGYNWEAQEALVEVRQAHAQGQISDSLFAAGKRAGVSDGLIMDLAYIFGWDIDFVLDVRRGDRFSVVYETHYQDGEQIGVGNILAAEFVNQGRVYRAIRYTPENGRTDYFDPDGRPMRKAFLRSPLNFTRISSRFTTNRKHPVLHKVRAHRGVDYAASRGTPVWATGDGKVILRGKKGGFGRTVIVRHGSRYSTLYAHLNSYSKKVRKGSRVKQGQIIGYVGSSGLATGPHLHYEFRVNGTHRDPLKIKLPSAERLPAAELARFEQHAAVHTRALDALEQNRLASIE